jgi:hypothetical protein
MTAENTDFTDIPAALSCLDIAKATADGWRAQVAKALANVVDAEASLTAATESFRSKPTPSGATSKAVAEQILANVRDEYDAICKNKEPREAEIIAHARVEYAKGTATLAHYTSETEVDFSVIVEVEATIRATVERMTQRAATAVATMRALEGAANTLGNLPLPRVVIDPTEYRRQIAERLRAKYSRSGAQSIHGFIEVVG